VSKDCNLVPSEIYREQLGRRYGNDVAMLFTEPDLWHRRIVHSEGDKVPVIPYVRPVLVRGRPTLYVPGFTESIVAKAAFAAELAEHRVDVILPGQNRHKILHDADGKKNATETQARNYLSVLKSANPNRVPVNVITHSYGSLIFDAMHRLAEQNEENWFDDSKVIMLAPAGTNEDETLPSLGKRFVRSFLGEAKTPKEFPDDSKDMMKAGMRVLRSNVPRAVREVVALAHQRVDYDRLLSSNIAMLAIAGYAEDELYSHQVLETTIGGRNLLDKGLVYFTPISLEQPLATGRGASHNDEQFNPSRVAGAVAELLAA